MNRIAKSAIGAAALVASAGAAHAVTHHVARGKIDHIDAGKRQLVLNHRAYRLSPSISTKGLDQGESIRVFYRDWNGHRMAYKIETLKS